MITLQYEPKIGIPFRDGDVDDYINAFKFLIEGGQELTMLFATDNILEAIRAAVVEKQIPFDSIQFIYGDEIIRINPDGGLSIWPEGFADYTAKKAAIIGRW